jgi:hypothetical protein
LVEEAGGSLACTASNLDEEPGLVATLTLTFLFIGIESSTAMVQWLGRVRATRKC